MEPGPARAKANWLRLFSRVRLQLQEVQPVCLCVFVHAGVHFGHVRPFQPELIRVVNMCFLLLLCLNSHH